MSYIHTLEQFYAANLTHTGDVLRSEWNNIVLAFQ